MTFKKLALAASLFAASVGANAAIQLAEAGNQTDGEVLFTVWNTDNQRALTVDLGIFSSELISEQLAPRTFDLDPADVAWLGTGDIRWNVVGVNTDWQSVANDGLVGYGYYFTVPTTSVDPNGGQSWAQFGAQAGGLSTYSNAIDGMRDGLVEGADISENLTYRSEGATYAGAGNVWGDPAGNIPTLFNVFSSTTADDILNGWIADFAGVTDLAAGAAVHQDVGNFWKLDLASNSLEYATPVPAAAWLFGSALLGLAGAVRRRRKDA